VLLFISLAYISISLDVTGLLRYLAFIVSQKGGTSGRRLFSSFYAFFFVSGMVSHCFSSSSILLQSCILSPLL
jgi:Na+/H+ antiporter NhaD/arsenite permease-like protein